MLKQFPETFLEAMRTVRYLLRWLPVAALAGLLAGTASAVLLVSLNWATDTREAHRWIIALLPLAGLLIGWMYLRFGTEVEAGNNLILDEIHRPTRTIPIRMTPLVLLGTVLTHLFGGSAGREGTAIQTGASLADQLAWPFRMGPTERRILLMSGISAGFASVFGTPLAGAVFGMELLAIGSVAYDAIAPCFFAAFVGDFTTRAWGVHHALYRISDIPALHMRSLLLSALAGTAFGLTAMAFAKSVHGISARMKRHVAWPPLRPFLGGIVVAAGVAALHSTRYIGLGLPTIAAAFGPRHDPQDWLLKCVFTAVTLGTGFKGGEVTPLFFIGATLGNALAYLLPLPSGLLAAMGFVAVFGGAANTPVASSFMAVELFGADAGAYAAIACVFSYLSSGHSGIYRAQRVGSHKHVRANAELTPALAAKVEDMSSGRTEKNSYVD